MTLSKIGRYEIKSELGRGGMATVFLAYDPSFERDVAIKVLPQVFLHDNLFRTRFTREAKMIASLEHSAIVPVYDIGEDGEQPYIVMRYMSGGSLSERLEKQALKLQLTAQITTRLAQALDAAHARQIVHRDLKPGNILFDQYGNAFLSDFGIARLEQAGTTLTGGALVGTPAYMSPEQIQGDKPVDGRSDIYALGVLVYQMMTGKQPYRSDTPAKAMMMHILQPVPNILEDQPNLPVECEALIKKAMAKNPDQRFATAGEMAAELEKIAFANASTITPAREPTVVGASTLASSRAETVVSKLASATPETVVTSRSPTPKTHLQLKAILLPAIGILCLALVILGGLSYFGGGLNASSLLASSNTALSPQPTQTQPASQTPLPPTATHTPVQVAAPVIPSSTFTFTPTASATQPPSPTPTETLTPTPAAPVIGGADKIAYLVDSDLWMANLDGSDLVRLSEDGTEKTSLQWSPDGKAIHYISGTCAYTLDIESGAVDIITCLNFVTSFKSFQVSPNNQQAAISLDNQLYIIPFDRQRLGAVRLRGDLAAMAECEYFAPYQNVFVKTAQWSADSSALAMKIFGTASGLGAADTIQILPVDQCVPAPRPLDNFPPPRFRYPEYENNPTIQNFGWDGIFLFALNSIIRNDGFGDLYVYNMELHKARAKINPINNTCCYRDPVWSPDGSHLLFAYQPLATSITQFYLIPYGSVGTSLQYSPLPLPDITEPRAKPQPILRPAQP